VFDGPSRVVDVAVRSRFFGGATRRAVQVRDRRCTWPGCDAPAQRCDVDHIIDYDHGGETTQPTAPSAVPTTTASTTDDDDTEPTRPHATPTTPPTKRPEPGPPG